MYMFHQPYYHSGFSWGGFIPFLFILSVVLLIWAIARHQSDNNEEMPEENATALDILKKRYAKGEITKKELVEMKKDIE